MNAIDRDDTAQKIAEIREKHSTGHYNYNYEVRDAIQFLLDELDSLRESLEEWRGDFEELRKDRDRMREEREELIEELKHYADRRNYPPLWLHEDGQKARNILKKIGVTVE